ncbi:MAG: peptide deformylase [Candidatus Liptonbacteria bacterium]|nr:peptide deformylase [Candidatus Liptonbacteria bacterium]
MAEKILTINNKKEEKFLRKETEGVDFKKVKRSELSSIILRMRKTMRLARGIGLSANQIGLGLRLFVAEVPDSGGSLKFYAVFNPKLQKISKEKVALEEGCLSVPDTYGLVDRPGRVLLTGFDKNGRPLKIKAWGILARVFQHEIDHLDGKLFIDRTKQIYKAEKG